VLTALPSAAASLPDQRAEPGGVDEGNLVEVDNDGAVGIRLLIAFLYIPAEARHAFRLDLPGARVEVILRSHELMLLCLAPSF
jgi:hypothetical protein